MQYVCFGAISPRIRLVLYTSFSLIFYSGCVLDGSSIQSEKNSNITAGPSSNLANSFNSACGGGTEYFDSQTPRTGEGAVAISTKPEAYVTNLSTTLLVPDLAPASGTIFLWPGLQPMAKGGLSDGFLPIDNGVLQPVLTWGPTCAPNQPVSPYQSWWISGQYVNPSTQLSAYNGCFGGPGMVVQPGDLLDIVMSLAGFGKWTQTITSRTTGERVSYFVDLEYQMQNYVEFVIEPYHGGVLSKNVEFTETEVRFANPVSTCQMTLMGANDSVIGAFLSPDHLTCCYSKISLQRFGN